MTLRRTRLAYDGAMEDEKIEALKDIFGEELARVRDRADRKDIIKVAYQAASLIQIGNDAKPKIEEIQEANTIIEALLCEGLDDGVTSDLSISATMVTGGSDDPAYRSQVIADMAKAVPAPEGRRIALAVALATSLVDGDLDTVEEEILGEVAAAFDLQEAALGELIEEVAYAVSLPGKEKKLEALAEHSAAAFEGTEQGALFKALGRAGLLMAMGGHREESTKELPLVRSMVAGIVEMDEDDVGRKLWDMMIELSKMSREDVLESVRASLPAGEARVTCLVLAAAVCLVDGTLDDDEASIYKAMAEKLEVAPDVAAEILRETGDQLAANAPN
jgi:hypothetical protein